MRPRSTSWTRRPAGRSPVGERRHQHHRQRRWWTRIRPAPSRPAAMPGHGRGVLVVGGVSKSGNAQRHQDRHSRRDRRPARRADRTRPTQALPSLAVSLSGNSTATISPGLYSQITRLGQRQAEMNPGIYVIEGGGFSVSGSGSVCHRVRQLARSPAGVTIYNTKSSTRHVRQYHLERQRGGSLTRRHARAVRRDPDLPGPRQLESPDLQRQRHAGDHRHDLAPAAQLVESGNAQIGSSSNPVSIVVDTLSISGNAIANVSLTAPAGNDRLHPGPDPRRLRHQQLWRWTAPARPSPSSTLTTTRASSSPWTRSTPSSA